MKNHYAILSQLFIISCISFLSLFSCEATLSSDNDKDVAEKASKAAAGKKVRVELDTVSFTLPEIAGSNTTSLQFLDFSSPQFSFYDQFNHDILIFDLETSEYLEKIELEREGPNGVGFGNTGVHWISEDSIFISNNMKLHLINRSGKVLKTYTLNLPELGGSPNLQVSTIHPVIKKSDKIYVSIYPQKSVFKVNDLKNWYNFLCINLKDGSMEPLIRLPNAMQENIYGLNFVDKSFVATEDGILISFYPLKDLYAVDFDELDTLVHKEINNPIFSDVDGMIEKNPSEFMTYTKHYLLNNSFDGLYKNDDYILRIAQKGISTEELKNRDWAKEKVFEVYDENLNLVYQLDTKSKYGNYFITLGYSNVFLSKIESKVEDVMVFLKLTIHDIVED